MHGQKQVTLEDVRAVMGDEAEARSESACDAAGSGDLARLDRGAGTALGVRHPVRRQVLRSAMGHFQKLLQARESDGRGRKRRQRDEAAAPAGAFPRASSPSRPRRSAGTRDKLGEALDMLLEAEVLTRTTGVPAEAVTAAP